MNNEEKIEYLNNIIYKKLNLNYGRPTSLFKYRPFDQFSFDMLEKSYIYCCPADKEDDETECTATFDFGRLIDLKTNNLKFECINQIIEMIRPYCSKDTFDIVKNRILSIVKKDGTVPANYMLDLSTELEQMLPDGVDIAPLVNWIVNIPKQLDNPEISNQLEPLFLTAYNARTEIGICSLAESNDIEYMWKKYAADGSGYCIEYDVSDYELNENILPVIYQDERETNIIIQLVESFLGQMITGLSDGQIIADASQFIRLFLTKYRKWEYQKEWRFIGSANDKPFAPKIKCIYLGKNVSEENKEKMIEFANTRNIDIVSK